MPAPKARFIVFIDGLANDSQPLLHIRGARDLQAKMRKLFPYAAGDAPTRQLLHGR